MGLLDKAKQLLGGRSGQIGDKLDDVAEKVDEKTGHKYTEKIAKGTEKAKEALGKLDDGGEGDATPKAEGS